MTVSRYRCHAALCRGEVTAPALVTIYPQGHADIMPYTAETFGTIDYNGVIVMAPPGTELPASVARDRIASQLREIEIPSCPDDMLKARLIPLG